MVTRMKPGRRNVDIDPELLPNQARAMRLAKDLSLEQLGQRIRVARPTLWQFETKGVGLGRNKQWALAEVLGTDISLLLKPGKKFAENIRKHLDIVR